MFRQSMPILSGAILTFKMYMSKWEKLANDHSHMKSIIQEGLNWVYKYYNQMDNTKVYVVAMCKQIISWPEKG